MRKLLAMAAIVLGGAGALLCVAAIGIAWWAAVKSADRLDQIAIRVDHGLAEVDAPLARIESRMNVIRSDLVEVRTAAEKITEENPELPRIRAQIEQLFDRLVPTLERADAFAESLRTAAAGIRTVSDIVDQFAEDPAATTRVRGASDKIDRAAEKLNGLRARIEESKAAKAVHLSREIAGLAREAIAGSELLADGLVTAREEIDRLRQRTFQWRDKIVRWVYIGATVNMLVWLWVGAGQLCLLGWGRRRLFVVAS